MRTFAHESPHYRHLILREDFDRGTVVVVVHTLFNIIIMVITMGIIVLLHYYNQCCTLFIETNSNLRGAGVMIISCCATSTQPSFWQVVSWIIMVVNTSTCL